MSKKTLPSSVPPAAMMLLKFIGSIEAPRGYGTIYGNNQDKLPRPLTAMTVSEVIQAQPGWTDRYGSSAAGFYQFMRATLKGIMEEVSDLPGSDRFDASLQDRLGYHLLLRRGYANFVAGRIDVIQFGKALAQEWASFPVLADCQGQKRNVRRGQSYYAGDGLNKSLVKPERVEAMLKSVLAAAKAEPENKPIHVPKPESNNLSPVPAPPSTAAPGSSVLGVVAAAIAASVIGIFGLLADLPCQWLGLFCGG